MIISLREVFKIIFIKYHPLFLTQIYSHIYLVCSSFHNNIIILDLTPIHILILQLIFKEVINPISIKTDSKTCCRYLYKKTVKNNIPYTDSLKF